MPGAIALKVIELRREDPTLRAIRIAEQLGISRERVRQILYKANLATTVPASIPTMRARVSPHRSSYRPAPVYHPLPTPHLQMPDECPKCQHSLLYREKVEYGEEEIWCAMCGLMIAFGKEEIRL